MPHGQNGLRTLSPGQKPYCEEVENMYKYLFFDDQRLYVRDGFKRCYGKPQLIPGSVYFDGHSSTDLHTSFVFRTDDGKYRMLYQGNENDRRSCCFIAVSDDGIHFMPEDVSSMIAIEDRIAENEIMPIQGEIAAIVEDNVNDPKERYKMLLTGTPNEELYITGVVLTSPDLVHWTQIEGVCWNGGAEPITSVIYSEKKQSYIILLRPYWGIRRIGYIETKDWRTYTPYELCLQVDSLDNPNEELYGIPAFSYEGYYIGFPLMYGDFGIANHAKYSSGTIKPQLAYSFNGCNWQRSLRQPFIDGMTEESESVFGWKNYLVWPASMIVDKDGSINIYASASGREHGAAFRYPGMGRIGVWKLRKDGFIGLVTENSDKEAVMATRENIWHDGELHLNLQAKKATIAVYETIGDDLLGTAQALAGYSHEDCIPFSGDCLDWVPQFKNDKKMEELSGKTLVIELRVTDGTVYSLSGDMTPAMNVEAARYRKCGIMPRTI